MIVVIMTKLEKLYSIIENSREVGVKLSKDVLQQVEEPEEGIIKEEILPALGNDIVPRLEPIKRNTWGLERCVTQQITTNFVAQN